MNQIISCFSLLLSIFGFVHCNGIESNTGNADASIGANQNLVLKVKHEQVVSTNHDYGKIDHYLMSVTGPDFKQTITSTVHGHSKSGEVLSIPIGSDITLTIEGYNSKGQVIRRGKREGITIAPGQLTNVEVVTLPVPIFVNLKHMSAVSSRQFKFRIFGAPDSELYVYDVKKDGAKTLIKEAQTNKEHVTTANKEGLFVFKPKSITNGVHHFMVEDERNKESSEVTVSVYERLVRPGITITGGGYVKSAGSDVIMGNAGGFLYREVDADAENLGNSTFLEIME